MSDEYGASSTKNDTLVNDSKPMYFDPLYELGCLTRLNPLAALEQITGKGNVGNYSDDSSDSKQICIEEKCEPHGSYHYSHYRRRLRG